jgi:hypothetical protein
MPRKPFDSTDCRAAEGESTDHIDHTSQKYQQKQTVNGPTNVIVPKSRPITSITPAEKVQ